METLPLTVAEIANSKDPFFLDWLDLYETSFPSNERMLVSDILRTLDEDSNSDERSSTHFLVLLDENKKCAGMMLYYTKESDKIAWLWYMAIKPAVQSQGFGSHLYHELVERLDLSGYKALFLEVEIPDETNSIQAERRIRFYEKQGACLLKDANYVQDIGWHAQPTPLFLMMQPFQPLDDKQAFDLAKKLFGGALKKQGAVGKVHPDSPRK